MATQDLPSKGMKAVLIRHTEKIVFGLACVICLALVVLAWMGGESEKRTPADLENQITTARNNVENTETWASAGREEDLSSNLETINNSEDNLLDRSSYAYDMYWHMPPFPPSDKRGDPELYPVMQLTVTGVGVAPVAYVTGASEQGPTRRQQNQDRARPGLGTVGGEEDEDEDPLRVLDPHVAERIPGATASTGAEAKSKYFVVITGLIPNRMQYEEYEATFTQASNYTPTRDVPNYYTWIVQRADVTKDPNGPVAEGDWERLAILHQALGDSGLKKPNNVSDRDWEHWDGTEPEVVDPDLTMDNYTGPIPPILLRDVTEAATHPEIPLHDPDAVEEETDDAADDEDESAEEAEEEDDDIFGMGGGTTQAGGAAASRDPRTITGRGGSEADPGDIEYKLFRYFDLEAKPGRVYRYRVQLWLEDPNNPAEADTAPPESSLQDEVLARVRESRVNYRSTPWSEPTEPVAVPFGSRLLAGPVSEPATRSIRGGGAMPAPLDDKQTGSLLVVVWDEGVELEDERVVPMDVFGVTQVMRGQVLQFVQTVDVLDPVKREFVRVPDYEFALDHVVLDMAGGEPLPRDPRDRSDKPMSGGQILLLDADGNLEVHDSLLEEDEYRHLQYLPEDPLDLDEDDTLTPGGGLDGLPGVPGVPTPPRRSGLDR